MFSETPFNFMFAETRFEFMFSETLFNFMFTGLMSFGNPPLKTNSNHCLFVSEL